MHMDTEDDEFWQLLSSTVDEIIGDLMEEEFEDAFLDDLEQELEELGQDYQDIWAPEDPHCIPPPPAQPRTLPKQGGGASRSTLDLVSVWSVTRCPKGGYFNIRQQELFDLLLERWKLTRWPKGGCFNTRQQEFYDLLLERWKLPSTASLPGRVVPYVDHAVPRYNGAFPKWREGRASGCWFPVCPETGELLLGTSCYGSKEDKREEDLKNSHVTCVSRVRRDAPYYCYYCNAT